MFQFVKKLFNKDGQLVDYYIDMMAEKIDFRSCH